MTTQQKQKTKIVIVGGGPAGLLLAHHLIRQSNFSIQLIEKRKDPRQVSLSNPDTLRSFPIALNTRGLSSLNRINKLQSVIEKNGVYCVGIALHNSTSTKYIPPRVLLRETPSLSVDRNILLLALLKELTNVEPATNTSLNIQFDTSVQNIDLSNNTIQVQQRGEQTTTTTTIKFDHLVATDGGKSVIRKQLHANGFLITEEKEISDDYKTIFLKRQSSSDDDDDDNDTISKSIIKLDDDLLHGWMMQKQSIKIIAAPVIAGCVSGALIFDKGQDPFRTMKLSNDVYEWLQQINPCGTLSKLVSEKEAAQLLARPVSTTVSVRCNRLNVGNQVLLLGDAAHSMSASVGQVVILPYKMLMFSSIS